MESFKGKEIIYLNEKFTEYGLTISFPTQILNWQVDYKSNANFNKNDFLIDFAVQITPNISKFVRIVIDNKIGESEIKFRVSKPEFDIDFNINEKSEDIIFHKDISDDSKYGHLKMQYFVNKLHVTSKG